MNDNATAFRLVHFEISQNLCTHHSRIVGTQELTKMSSRHVTQSLKKTETLVVKKVLEANLILPF